jgi:hypothetical protein
MVSLIDAPAVIEKILRHLRLWRMWTPIKYSENGGRPGLTLSDTGGIACSGACPDEAAAISQLELPIHRGGCWSWGDWGFNLGLLGCFFGLYGFLL